MPTILKGFHRPLVPKLGLFKNKERLFYQVRFTNSCRYWLPGEDQADTNKLFGVGYFPSHHWESARFGWRYDLAEGGIVLSAYCYLEGTRVIKDICTVPIGVTHKLCLNISDTTYQFFVFKGNYLVGRVEIDRGSKYQWGFPLGLYFGGQAKAPHKITVKLNRI